MSRVPVYIGNFPGNLELQQEKPPLRSILDENRYGQSGGIGSITNLYAGEDCFAALAMTSLYSLPREEQ